MQDEPTSPTPTTASSKPWWKSKTILGLIPAIVALLAPSVGLEIGDEETRDLVNGLSGAASIILVAIGRKAAKGGITL